MYCTKCKTNWASLYSCDEGVEYCPICLTDYFLETNHDGDTFIMCGITGRIKNITTGKYVQAMKINKPVSRKPFIIDDWRAEKERREKLEDEQINNYIKVYETEGKEAAEKAFFKK